MKIIEKFLDINKYSRPGKKKNGVRAIVIHYVGNPKSTAINNNRYFNNLKDGAKGIYASSEFLVGLDGEVIQNMPEDEVAYHCGAKKYRPGIVEWLSSSPNSTTIGIEMCHPDNTGKPNKATYDSTVELVRMLVTKYKLTKKDIIMHKDVTGKDCHAYYIRNPQLFEQLKNDVFKADTKKEVLSTMEVIFEEQVKELESLFSGDTNYVKLRDICDLLGFNVVWDNKTKKTTLVKK